MWISQPGRILSFNRRKPAAHAAAEAVQKLLVRLDLVEGQPDLDCRARAADEFVERLALLPGTDVPQRHVERRLRVAVAAERFEQLGQRVAVGQMLLPTAAGASQSRRHAYVASVHSGPCSGPLPGLASPQPVTPSADSATSTVSNVS